ncbi:Small ribosomal subunit biogenesis GTPase RsgA [Candidatus Hydrogenisulfobacillus filiaventi]|uniref:Small ribosomal subunit biogenesis GTPase RsgA n=1 Tax=Candidatus Hydrogenisulfobacillus filiaventi TaxID=2707344 RepID=A0A6F8ZH16_9FIRM|nr:ribosome small subunit-dependent GTPase A [Bacillota bacterium]CAB1129177.1 Small ribosomal subunit biogenesis GTPase RsgA [Candidatus Hydrogenisulfobacillus filiaventi]
MQGRVETVEANRPTVWVPADGRRYLCHLRGRLKLEAGRILAGDEVEIEVTDPEAGEARILQVLPRRRVLGRPPVANPDGVLACFSLRHPEGSRWLLDRRLVAAELLGLAAEVVVTKVDLVEDPGPVETLAAVYRAAGYPVWAVSSRTGTGLDAFRRHPRSGIWVLSGESGAGKSSLLNRLVPAAGEVVQELSRIGRGRQTTRRVRIVEAGPGWWLADTPGFTHLDLHWEDPLAVRAAFREWEGIRCRFPDCLHGEEPGCGVRAAVEAGTVDALRYHHYRRILAEGPGHPPRVPAAAP